MSGKLIKASEVDRQQWPGMGDLGFISNSFDTTRNLLADLVFAPGDGFNFHHHPNQEEVLYLMEGTLEVWVEKDKATMSPGDTLYFPAGSVHAAFNVSDRPAKMYVVLSPPIPSEELKFELVDVSGEEPWASLR